MVDVLIDMTALTTTSRHRGIGRYVSGLCTALAQLAPKELSLAGLIAVHGSENITDPSLSFTGDGAREPTSLGYSKHKMARRLFLGTTARRTGARLLHLTDPYGTPFSQHTPRIVTCHDLIPLLYHREYYSNIPGSRWLQWLRDCARYKGAQLVVAISESTKRDLVEHLGISPDRIRVVYHGIDHARYCSTPAQGERREVARYLGFDAPYLLYVGAADARKDVPKLVRAYAKSGYHRDVFLVWAGAATRLQRRRVEQAIRQVGVEGRVYMLGYAAETLVPALYRQCLGHVFPSSYEGFGLTVVEAMACGAPTITNRSSSLPEVTGGAALSTESTSEEALSRAMALLISDEDLRAKLRAGGIAQAAQFTWERCARETLTCYEQALSS